MMIHWFKITMIRVSRVSIIVVIMGLFLLSFQARASLFEPVSDLQLVCEATDIIHGEIIDVQGNWDKDGQAIWTTATVLVRKALKGFLASDSQIQVKEVGGTVDDYTIKAEGFPTFRSGEEVVFLLRPWGDESGTYRVWGYGRGMFSVERKKDLQPAVSRYDVVESGRPTMHIDRISPRILLDNLERELHGLGQRCQERGPSR